MTEEEKKTMLNKYANLCAQIGETQLSIEIAEESLTRLRQEAKELLKQIKEAK